MGENEKAHSPTAQPVGEEANNEKVVVAPVSDNESEVDYNYC